MDEIAANEVNLLNLEPEVVLLKALVSDFINRFSETSEALLHWHQSYTEPMHVLLSSNAASEVKTAIMKLRDSIRHRPSTVLDLSSVSLLVDRLGKMVERIYRMRTDGAVSMDTLRGIFEQMALVVVRHCDAETARAIEKDWQKIIVLERK